jgi:hypothetical protein
MSSSRVPAWNWYPREGDEVASEDSTSEEEEPVAKKPRGYNGKGCRVITFLQGYVEQHSSHHGKGDVEHNPGYKGKGDVEHPGYVEHPSYKGKGYVEHPGYNGKGYVEHPGYKGKGDVEHNPGYQGKGDVEHPGYVEHSGYNGKGYVEHPGYHGKGYVEHPGYHGKGYVEHRGYKGKGGDVEHSGYKGKGGYVDRSKTQRGTKSRAGKNIQEKRALLKSAPDTAVAIGKLFKGEATLADMDYLKNVFGQPQVDELLKEAIKATHKLLSCTGARAVDV